MSMSSCVLHIPHSSAFVPEEERGRYLKDLGPELLHMTDWYTDELFGRDAERLVFPVSRLVCDVERFRDDAREEMASIGMGAVYTRGYDRAPLRRVTAEERERLLRRWYDPHHRRLEEMAGERLAAYGRCLIVDCHSFPPVPLPYERDRSRRRPEICIGTDPFHTPAALAEGLAERFGELGYEVAFDTPYSGCMVPQRYYRRDPRVRGVMIEVSRGLYLDAEGRKTDAFPRLRRDLSAVLAPFVSGREDGEDRGGR